MMMLLQPQVLELEQLVDRFSVREVLAALVEICELKAQHVEENWQDAPLARDWRDKARRVQRIVNRVGK